MIVNLHHILWAQHATLAFVCSNGKYMYVSVEYNSYFIAETCMLSLYEQSINYG